MKNFIVSLFCFLLTYIASAQDISKNITQATTQGNAHSIMEYASNSIKMNILTQSNVYSKNQAEWVLKSFFDKHAVKSFTLQQKGSKEGDTFINGLLKTADGDYTIYYLIKNTNSIQEITIEEYDN